MKKIFLLLSVNLIIASSLFSQQSQIEIGKERLYQKGKELYAQRKYAASISCFEEFLQEVDSDNKSIMQDAEYYVAINSYALKQSRAQLLLEDYIKRNPYSPYRSRVCFMLGRIRYENEKYKHALTWYDEVKEKDLIPQERLEFLYTKAYSLLEMKKYAEAKKIFNSLSNEKNEYSNVATYYSAYIDYLQKNNKSALNGFLKIEETEEYKDIVPYYIVQIYYEEKEYKKSLEHGKKMLESNPNNKNNSEVYRIMGECAYRENVFNEAIVYFGKYEKLAKKLQRNSSYMYGMSFFQEKDYVNAVKYLTRATTPEDSIAQNAYLHLGHSYLLQNDKNNARMAFEAASKTDFSKQIQEEALYNYALSSYETNAAFGESLSALESFIETFPNSKYLDKVYDHIVSIFLSNKNYSSAYQSISKMKTLTPKMKEVKEYVLFQLGTQAFAKSDYKNATKMFSESIAENTDKSFSAQAYLWRGESNYRLGQYQIARKDFETFLSKPQKKSTENLINTYYGIGYTYFSEKSYTNATSWFLKCIQQPQNANSNIKLDALNRLGDCYFYERNFTSARKYYNQVIEAKTKGADYATFQNAFILGLQKRYNEKIEILENLLKTMPNSEYRGNALYEIGRSYVMLEKNSEAISTYQEVVEKYPKNTLARKASLEIGMLYFNIGEAEKAKQAYKQVIAKYKGSDEARTAFESLEALHVETNDVQAFLEYCKTLGRNYAASVSGDKGDSLSFIAAERVYAKEDYTNAIVTLKQYLQQYCISSSSKNCITARYYLASSYYNLEKFDEALNEYKEVSLIDGNKYIEESLIRSAEITYNKKQYEKSQEFFKKLLDEASNTENRNIARLGVLRCSHFQNDYKTTINIANEILAGNITNEELERESRYNRAKAHIALNQTVEAEEDLRFLSQDLMQEMGSESKYLLAQYLFDVKKLDESEAEIFDFIEKNTPYQFWLARCFVLLADIYVEKGDDFQAKQYLLSLRDNYKVQDDIQGLIAERLEKIEKREKDNAETEK